MNRSRWLNTFNTRMISNSGVPLSFCLSWLRWIKKAVSRWNSLLLQIQRREKTEQNKTKKHPPKLQKEPGLKEEVSSGATAEAPSSGSLLGRRQEKKQLSVLPPLLSFCRASLLSSCASPSYLLHRNFKFCQQVHTNHVIFPTVTNCQCYNTVKHLSADKLSALELTLELQVISCTPSGPWAWQEMEQSSFCTSKPFEFP